MGAYLGRQGIPWVGCCPGLGVPLVFFFPKEVTPKAFLENLLWAGRLNILVAISAGLVILFLPRPAGGGIMHSRSEDFPVVGQAWNQA